MKNINVISMKTLTHIICIFAIFVSAGAFAQSEGVSIKTTAGAPDPSAMLDVVSGSKGLLIPRVSLSSTSNTTSPVSGPATGLMVYNTNTGITGTGAGGAGFYYYNGSLWVKFNTGATTPDLWSLDPNAAPNGIYRNGGTVTVGSSTITANATTTLNVYAPSVFFAQHVASTTTGTIPAYPSGTAQGFGLHVGDPNNHQGVPGGHSNEINNYREPLDLQWFTKQDVRIGAFGGSNLFVGKGGQTNMGSITAESNVVAYGIFYSVQGNWSASDSTIKKNFSLVTDAMDKLQHLNTYTFNFKTENVDDKKHIGIIAQEVESEFPELVVSRSLNKPDFSSIADGKSAAGVSTTTVKTVDYQGLTALLLEGLKEQQATINELKARLHELDGK